MQAKVFLRFYEELNDYLPPDSRKVFFTYYIRAHSTVTDLLQTLGVPLDKIDLILVNGESVDLSYSLHDGDRVSVYPVFESLDITPQLRVRPRPLREISFVVDTQLGKLAKYLRMLGFDTLYKNTYEDDALIALSRDQGRILLSRDCDLIQHNDLTRAYHIRTTIPREQIVEVLIRFDLFSMVKPFCRCLRCNEELQPVRKQDVIDRLPPETGEHYDEFWMCAVCGRAYWEGSHLHNMDCFVHEILAFARAQAQGRK